MTKRPILAANWKMNLPTESFDDFVAAAGSSPSVELVIAPPFPFLGDVAAASRPAGYALAGQNVSEHASGAYTGEVSGAMLRRCGAEYVIVGHSERRSLYGEDDATIGRKLLRALTDGLKPIFCVGERRETRDAGETNALLESQLRGALAELTTKPDELVIAYEPVWAIGTGLTATPEIADEAHRVIREVMRSLAPNTVVRIQYGGSVTPDNAAALSAKESIDGFLVGGASLDGVRFGRIRQALEEAAREKA